MTNKTTKVAIITGSGRGIGRGTAIQLAQAGWTIVINDFGNPEPPKETLELVKAAGGDGMIIMANITVPAEREHIIQETLHAYGRLDMLVNNAGIGPRVRMDMLEIGEESMHGSIGCQSHCAILSYPAGSQSHDRTDH